jgi:hypothetical protein
MMVSWLGGSHTYRGTNHRVSPETDERMTPCFEPAPPQAPRLPRTPLHGSNDGAASGQKQSYDRSHEANEAVS